MLSFILVIIALLIAGTAWLVFDMRTTSLNDALLDKYGFPTTDAVEQQILKQEYQFAYMAELKQRYARKRAMAAQQGASNVAMPVVLA